MLPGTSFTPSLSAHPYFDPDTQVKDFQHLQMFGTTGSTSRSPSPRAQARGLSIPYRSSPDDNEDSSCRMKWINTRPSPISSLQSSPSKPKAESKWTAIFSKLPKAGEEYPLRNGRQDHGDFVLPLMSNLGEQLVELVQEIKLRSSSTSTIKLYLHVDLPGSSPMRVRLTETSWPVMFGRFVGRSKRPSSSRNSPNSSLDASRYVGDAFHIVNPRRNRMNRHASPHIEYRQASAPAGMSFYESEDRSNLTTDPFTYDANGYVKLPLPALAQRTGLPIAAKIFFELSDPPARPPSTSFASPTPQASTSYNLPTSQSDSINLHLRELSLAQSYPLDSTSRLTRPELAPSLGIKSRRDAAEQDSDGESDDQDWYNPELATLRRSESATTFGGSITRSRTGSFQDFADSCEETDCSPLTTFTGHTSITSSQSIGNDSNMATKSLKSREKVPQPLLNLLRHSSLLAEQRALEKSAFAISPLGIVIPVGHGAAGSASRPRAASALPAYSNLSTLCAPGEALIDDSGLPTSTTGSFCRSRAVTQGETPQCWTEQWDEAAHHILEKEASQVPSTPSGLFYESWVERADGGIDGHLGAPADDSSLTRSRSNSNFTVLSSSTISSIDVPHETEWPVASDSTMLQGGRKASTDSRAVAKEEAPAPSDFFAFVEQRQRGSSASQSGQAGDFEQADPSSPAAWADLAQKMESPGALRLLCLAASDWPSEVKQTGQGLTPLLKQQGLVRSRAQNDRPSINITATAGELSNDAKPKKPEPLKLKSSISSHKGFLTRPRALSNVFDIALARSASCSEGGASSSTIPTQAHPPPPVVDVKVASYIYPDLVIYAKA